MEHPQHGFHVCGDSEVPGLAAQGWKVWTPRPKVMPIEEAPTGPEKPKPALIDKVRKSRQQDGESL